MEQDRITKIESELLELKARARNIGYKNEIPRLPKNIRVKTAGLQESLLSGFTKRLSNWERGLLLMENPGGLTLKADNARNLAEATTNLVHHFNGNTQ